MIRHPKHILKRGRFSLVYRYNNDRKRVEFWNDISLYWEPSTAWFYEVPTKSSIMVNNVVSYNSTWCEPIKED